MLLQGPDEVPDQKGMLPGIAHGVHDSLPSGLRAQQDPLRMKLMEGVVFVLIIIVSRNVQIRVEIFRRLLVHPDKSGGIGQIFLVFRNVGRRAQENPPVMLPVLLLILRALSHPFVLVPCQVRNAVQIFPQPVDAGAEGGGPCGIDAADNVHNLLSHPDSLHAACLRDLVSDGVNHHAGMVVGILHHGPCVFPEGIQEQAAVGIPSLGAVPVVKGLVHDIQPHLIAGLHQAPGHGMVGGTEGVEPGFLQDSGPVQFRGIIIDDSYDTVVVMDAASPQECGNAVDQKPFFRIHLNGADAEAFRHFVIYLLSPGQGDRCLVKLRGLRAPELRIRNLQLQAYACVPCARFPFDAFRCSAAVFRFPAAVGRFPFFRFHLPAAGSHCFPILPDIHGYQTGPLYLHVHLNPGRMDSQGGHLHPGKRNMVFLPYAEMHRAVDSSARIPAAMPLLRHIGLHADLIVPAESQIRVQGNPKGGESIRLLTDRLPIDIDPAHTVDRLEFQDQGLMAVFLRRMEGFRVNVFSSFESRQQEVIAHPGVPVRIDYGVMGKGHSLPAPRPLLCKNPVMVEIDFFHGVPLLVLQVAAPLQANQPTHNPPASSSPSM